MGRLLLLILMWVGLAGPTAAAPTIAAWETCEAGACRPLDGVIDPYGRLIEVRGRIEGGGEGPWALRIGGAASSEVWFNGVRLGANGHPAAAREAEIPGRYESSFVLPQHLWKPDGNVVTIRFSGHHMGIHFDRPISDIRIGKVGLARPWGGFGVTFGAIGALIVGFTGFAALAVTRPAPAFALLCAISGVVALQGLAESLRWWIVYPYPFHAWRMVAIWLFAASFAVLLPAYTAERFWPGRRRAILAVAVLAAAATWFIPGFDRKVAIAIELSVGLSIVVAAVGLRAGRQGAKATLAYLGVHVSVLLLSPGYFLDHAFFLLVAALVLALLIGEVGRIARRDRDREAALTRAASSPGRLSVATARGVELVRIEDIVAVVGADDYAELRLTGGRRLLHAARLDHLEANLPDSFSRIHRSAIANLDHATGLVRDDQRWRLELSEGEPLPVSRARLAGLKARLEPA
jgi:DNA-binding LytR/AlgR family response regulator